MKRNKITTYVTSDINEKLLKLAKNKDLSVSKVVSAMITDVFGGNKNSNDTIGNCAHLMVVCDKQGDIIYGTKESSSFVKCIKCGYIPKI